MAIRNVRGEGAIIPEPDDEVTEKSLKRRENDPVDEIERSYYRGRRVAAFASGAGIEGDNKPSASAPKTEEKTQLNIGDIFKSQGDTLNTVLTQLTQVMANNQNSAQNVELSRVREELVALKNQYQSSDPIDSLMKAITLQDTITDRIKKSIQPATQSPSSASLSLEAQVHLKKLEIELETMRQQHQERMDTMRAQWAREEKNNDRQYNLELMKFDADGGRRTELLGTISQAVSAFVDGKMGQVGASGVSARPKPKPGVAASPPPEAVKSIVCDKEGCGAVIKLIEGVTSVTCPECGETYDMVPVPV
ncbi:MAG: hypothetical protein WC331_10020 [Candidatus Omnitrophota bacterium]|jgi:hypothetical protein